jgi:uncharacterized protein
MVNTSWVKHLLKETPLRGRIRNARKFYDFIEQEYEKELRIPPRIAIIGSSGVGKSSTINALFGTSLPVSHTRAATRHAVEIPVEGEIVEGAKGDLILYDMPGIGEDIDKDEEYEEIYRRIIAQCDVAVWVVSATDRRIAHDQRVIRDVVRPANEQLVNRLVIGVNKADLIYPGNWNKKANLPSRKQEDYLYDRLQDIRDKLIKVCPGLTEDRIIAYSAKQRYHLLELFGGMLRACPEDRAWVLDSRQEIASYWELVSPDLREKVQDLVERAL